MRVARSLCAVVLAACSPRPPAEPHAPAAPPAPQTVTLANPGGDASDPEEAALERLAREPWATRRDRTGTLLVPLADARNWTRVRIWTQETRAAYRYGDEHYGIIAIWYAPTTGDDSPAACLARFVDEARPKAEVLGAHVLETHVVRSAQRATKRGEDPKPMVIQVVDARVDGIFTPREYAAAIASSPTWPHTCLIHAFAVPARKHPELARRVRDRWVEEGAPRLMWNPRVKTTPAVDDF